MRSCIEWYDTGKLLVKKETIKCSDNATIIAVPENLLPKSERGSDDIQMFAIVQQMLE